jgi:predicted site-specific integrase-resolvase
LVQRDGAGGSRRRLVLHYRVPASDRDNDRQVRDPREYAERAGFGIVEVFRETLSVIRKAKGKQPIERKKLMALAQDRRMDQVLVTEETEGRCRSGAFRSLTYDPVPLAPAARNGVLRSRGDARACGSRVRSGSVGR